MYKSMQNLNSFCSGVESNIFQLFIPKVCKKKTYFSPQAVLDLGYEIFETWWETILWEEDDT